LSFQNIAQPLAIQLTQLRTYPSRRYGRETDVSDKQVPAAEPASERGMTPQPSEWPSTEEDQAQDDADEVSTP